MRAMDQNMDQDNLKPKKTKKEIRDEKLAKALRDNLRRRKATDIKQINK